MANLLSLFDRMLKELQLQSKLQKIILDTKPLKHHSRGKKSLEINVSEIISVAPLTW